MPAVLPFRPLVGVAVDLWSALLSTFGRALLLTFGGRYVTQGSAVSSVTRISGVVRAVCWCFLPVCATDVG